MNETTTEKLQSILLSKDAIKTAIEAKGVTVGDALLEDYADLIEDIPTGQNYQSPFRITLKSQDVTETLSIRIQVTDSITSQIVLLYRTNTNTEWNYFPCRAFPDYFVVTLNNNDDYIQFVNLYNYFSNNYTDKQYYNFNLQGTGTAKLSGKIISLINYSNQLPESSFNRLFYNQTVSMDASQLILPQITSQKCYRQMFWGCTGLTQAPALPATTLARDCYSSMFWGCTGLTTAPELPATTLAQDCYSTMFYGCTSLSSIEVNFTTWGRNNNYGTNYWVGSSNFSESGTFTKPTNLPEVTGVSNIPEGWTVVNK